MLKIEFDASNKALAAAIGAALTQYGGGGVVAEAAEQPAPAEKSLTEKVPDIVESTVTVRDADTGETVAEETIPATEENDGPVDEHGVPHNKKYCGPVDAAVPFYASGSNKGQWKKKRGVDESEYNEWYVSVMPMEQDEPTEANTPPVNTGAAFGNKQEAAPASNGPANSGELMAYISERQAGGTLDQATVTAAYNATGVTVNDLFDQAKEAEAVAKLYNHLQNVSV